MMLREALISVLSDAPCRKATRRIVQICHPFAVVSLKRRFLTGSLFWAQAGLTVDELAWDILGELFRRDEAGTFPALRVAFEDHDIVTVDETVLVTALRRQTIHAVQDGMFRRYGELDPALRRIIRNLKLAIVARNDVRLDCSAGFHRVMIDDDRDVPVVEFEGNRLEAFLVTVYDGDASIPVVLSQIIDYLRELPFAVPPVNLSRLALIIRRAAVRLNGEVASFEHQPDPFFETEVKRCISRAIGSVKTQKMAKYVPHKWSFEEYETCFKTLHQYTEDRFFGDAIRNDSLFTYLNKRMPAVTPEAYSATYKSRMEYLSRIVEAKLVSLMRGFFE